MTSENLDSLLEPITDGASIAIPPSRSGVAVAATRAFIERGVRDLHLIAIPTSGIQADMLIGAGCVAMMESAGVTLDEQGQAPLVRRSGEDRRRPIEGHNLPGADFSTTGG